MSDSDQVELTVSVNEIEERIKALDRELAESSNEESSSVLDSDSESSGAKIHRKRKYVSDLIESDRIDPLPPSLLPLPGCGMPKKKKRNSTLKGMNGLESTVKELLSNYESRSSEHIPFYCRMCKYQGEDAAAFENHLVTKIHQLAVAEERRISFCKLCKQQFTSPAQLQEHALGKAHKTRLEWRKKTNGKHRHTLR